MAQVGSPIYTDAWKSTWRSRASTWEQDQGQGQGGKVHGAGMRPPVGGPRDYSILSRRCLLHRCELSDSESREARHEHDDHVCRALGASSNHRQFSLLASAVADMTEAASRPHVDTTGNLFFPLFGITLSSSPESDSLTGPLPVAAAADDDHDNGSHDSSSTLTMAPNDYRATASRDERMRTQLPFSGHGQCRPTGSHVLTQADVSSHQKTHLWHNENKKRDYREFEEWVWGQYDAWARGLCD